MMQQRSGLFATPKISAENMSKCTQTMGLQRPYLKGSRRRTLLCKPIIPPDPLTVNNANCLLSRMITRACRMKHS